MLRVTVIFLLLILNAQAKEIVSSVEILQIAIKNPICKDMDRFKPKHVEEFFLKAKPITQKSNHDNYDELDCHVRGKLKIKKTDYLFDIYPAGLGILTKVDSQKRQIFGCKRECEHLFPPKD